MSPESTDDFGMPSQKQRSTEPVFLTRREVRAAREAAAKTPQAGKEQRQSIGVTPESGVAKHVIQAEAAPASAGIAKPATAVCPATAVRADSAPAAVTSKSSVSPKRALRRPLRAVTSLALIGGLFAVAGLPAYGQGSLGSESISMATASSPSLSPATATPATASVQSLTVSGELTVPTLKRDQFEATSPEDLALIRQQAAAASANALYAASGARELGDDYPWPTAGDTLSPLNYYYRQCTDFVAWRLNRDVGSFSAPFRWAWSDLTPNGGDAYQWKSAWEAHGWTVSSTPVIGSVAWFGWDNHVSYVKQVNADGSVLIEEYNYNYRVYGQRTLHPGEVEAFLYPPGQ